MDTLIVFENTIKIPMNIHGGHTELLPEKEISAGELIIILSQKIYGGN
jgi:hypothetical protein